MDFGNGSDRETRVVPKQPPGPFVDQGLRPVRVLSRSAAFSAPSRERFTPFSPSFYDESRENRTRRRQGGESRCDCFATRSAGGEAPPAAIVPHGGRIGERVVQGPRGPWREPQVL